MQLRFYTLDVFTETRFGGNPLAVVLNADALPAGLMQDIARELNLSETVFVQKATNPAASARVRIFTPAVELPFAGHPTIGTGILLAQLRATDAATDQDALVVLEETIGRNLSANAERVGAHLRARLETLMHESAIIGEVRGKGLLNAIELVADKSTKAMLPRKYSTSPRSFSERTASILRPADAAAARY